MGAWYYTSCCILYNCQMHLIARSQVRSEVHSRAFSQRLSHLHSMPHSQPASLYSSQPAAKKLPSTLLRRFSCTLPIALHGTLLACLTVCSQESSQDAPKYTEYVLQYTHWHAPNETLSCTPRLRASLLGCKLPKQCSRSSQAHSRASS